MGSRASSWKLSALTKRQMIFSRSFSTPVTTLDGMHQVMSLYAQSAAIRLSRANQLAKSMTVFAGTSPFHHAASSFPSVALRLAAPTADPLVLTRAAVGALDGPFVDGVPYARAGVMLTDLSPAGYQPQFDAFVSVHERRNIGALLGQVTDRYGATSIGLGRAGISTPADWTMSRRYSSPRYTTEWDELAIVKAG